MTHVPLAEGVFALDGFLPPHECADLIARMEARGFSIATTKENGGQAENSAIRNNDRASAQCPDLAREWMDRARPFLPHAAELWEGFRCYRYGPGHEFKTHLDWPVEGGDLRSRFTLMVYLNADFDGGSTTFYKERFDSEPYLRVVPVPGRALVFQQAGMYHSGEMVNHGIKYVLRTDVMYKPLP